MGCGDEKLSKYLTQTFTAHCNAMICQQVTLLGDAEWPKVADAVIEARPGLTTGYPRRRLPFHCIRSKGKLTNLFMEWRRASNGLGDLTKPRRESQTNRGVLETRPAIQGQSLATEKG